MANRTRMIHHISRLEGQLESVKAELLKGKPDCERASSVLLSASRSFATLREQFVECFLNERFIDAVKTKRQEKAFASLLTLIKG